MRVCITKNIFYRYRKLTESTESNVHKSFLQNKLENDFEEALQDIDRMEQVLNIFLAKNF